MDRKEYSLYYKKNRFFVDICVNLKRTIQCLYSIEENQISNSALGEATISILIDIGVIENKDELLVLKEKLGKRVLGSEEFDAFIKENLEKLTPKK